jgi:predicted helicase
LPRVYKEQLFANEVMLLPYYIAALNIEHAYFERTDTYEPFEGLCFVDTLDMTEDEYVALFTQENTERIRRQKKTPITVVIGNAPYNAWQLDQNDNNKNRKYPAVEQAIKATYVAASKATNKNALWDPYVKFFRWATDRLRKQDGIVCFVSNNSFVDQIAFDGMRKHLAQDFTRIYHVHLEGNVRHNPTLAGTTYNVFGIQVGVGITLAVRCSKHTDRSVFFHRIDKLLRREEKLAQLAKLREITTTPWTEVTPDSKSTWLVPAHAGTYADGLSIGDKSSKASDDPNPATIFKTYGRGVATCRDATVYEFERGALGDRVRKFIEDYNGEVDRYKRSGSLDDVDGFVKYELLKWSRDLKVDLSEGVYAEFADGKVRKSLFRPFCKVWLFFDNVLNEEVYVFPHIFPTERTEEENIAIAVSDIAYRANVFSTLMTRSICDLHLCATTDGHQCFPFYVYDEDGGNRRENITDWALEQFRTHYGDAKITKWDIFYYVYGLLHHPGYRTKFADNLKHELPRIPFAPEISPAYPDGRGSSRKNDRRPAESGFWAFADAARKLATLHLDYEKLEPWDLHFIETEGIPLSYRVDDKMRLSKDKTSLKVNASLTLAGIPPEVFEYRLGNRSALDWIIDQYQVTQDKRSGIRSDPNRADDPEYIVRLVGQVVRVSVETVKIVNGLPERYTEK